MVVLLAGNSHLNLEGKKVLFLAGPTTRRQQPSNELTDWRRRAVGILEEIKFDGIVCIPEPYTGAHDGQVAWEQEWLEKATTIVFWIERNYAIRQYATTTNIEFGQFIGYGTPKVVYGRPDDADAVRSNDWHARKNKVEIYSSLEELLHYATSL